MEKELEAMVERYNLVSRTFESFWLNYDSYIDEEPEESAENGLFDRNSIDTELHSYSFVVSKQSDCSFIEVEIEMILKKRAALIGRYWCIFDLLGNFIDDYFVID